MMFDPWKLGDAVNVIGPSQPGRIDGLMLDSQGLQVRVVFWNAGTRYQIWLHVWEIEPRKETCKVGF
jgi:hypothetical protein